MFFRKRRAPQSSLKVFLGDTDYLNLPQLYVDFVNNNGHWLIVGKTRSGKSVALYSLLSQIVPKNGSAKLVEIAGLDPTGIIFSCLNNVPERYSGMANPDAFIQVMKGLVSEMELRIEKLLTLKRDKLEVSNEHPIKVIVLEELPGIVNSLDRKKQQEFMSLFLRLVAEGAKVNFRVIALAQRGDAKILDGFIRAQFTNVLCFRSERNGVRMLFPDLNADSVNRVNSFEPGEAYVILSDLMEPIKVKFPLVTYEQFRVNMGNSSL